jgi:succinate-acetate transporter protein
MSTYRDIKSELTISPQQLPKVANPAPLGLAGFGITTVLLSCINAGLLPADAVNAVVPLAFAFGGAAQIIAGILEYVNGNTFGLVAFTAYGTFWWWYAFMLWTVGAGWIKAPAPAAVAVALLLWGVFTLYMWVSTFRANKGVWTVFLLLWITFFLLSAGDFGTPGAKALGGYIGILTGIAAMYVSFAEVTNGAFGRPIIPLGVPFVKESTKAPGETGIRAA